MANHKSAEKRNRQSEKRRMLNRQHARRLRTEMKKIALAVESKDAEQVKSLLSPTLSLIDKSVQKGVLHKNAASRHKSRLAQKANGLLAAPTVS